MTTAIIHLAERKTVSIGMLLNPQHLGYHHTIEGWRNWLAFLNLEPGHGEPMRQLLRINRRVA
jgi:hypothetical protein